MHKSLITTVAAAGFIISTHAFWRMECPGRVGLARIDPIVNPGAVSTHLHAIHGSSGFSETSGTADLLAGSCTSCRVTQDKSAYWHPGLYFQDAATGEFELVEQVGGMLAYYLLYGENVTAFPANFQMLSGNTFRRNYTLGDPSQPDPQKSIWAQLNQTSQNDLSQRAIGFNCLNYAKAPEGTLYRHYMPDKAYLDANCQDGLRFEIMFPSCWKGGDAIDSPNHKDHVAFPDLVMTGNCPADFPVRLPSLLYEIIWNTPAFKSRNGRFVLANGDTTGYGLHGDFIMGWEETFLQQAVNTCTDPSGRIEDCPLFNLVDQGTARQCQLDHMPEALRSEGMNGPMAELPGNVQITFGDGSAEPGNGNPGPGVTSVVLPTLTYKAGETASPSGSPKPGQVLKDELSIEVISIAYISTTTTPAPEMTSAPEATPSSESASFFSTEYITTGNIVSEILWKQEIVLVTEAECETATACAAGTASATETTATSSATETSTATAAGRGSSSTTESAKFTPRGQGYRKL